ncbi:MAG: PKD domain-containing protein [Bacteroidia bacterium]|nr:PKD domain-containing protein [Bacteroidia bacterium]
MKKITLIFSLLFVILNVQGQKLWKGGQIDYTPQNFKQTTSTAELNSLKGNIKNIDRSLNIEKTIDCSTDTSLFPLFKATSLGLDGISNATNRFATALQRYSIPQGGSAVVNGFDFYAFFVFDSTNASQISTTVNANIYASNDGGAPNYTNPLATVTVTVDTAGTNDPSGSIALADTRYTAVFPTPVAVTDTFYIEIEVTNNDLIGLFRNNLTENNIAGDGRGFEDGWVVFVTAQGAVLTPATNITANNGAVVWDVDYLLHPYIEYSISPAFELNDASCLAHGEAAIFDNQSSIMTGNPYYNVFAADALINGAPDSTWLWIQNNVDQNSPTTWGTRDYVTVYNSPLTEAFPRLEVFELGYSRLCQDSAVNRYDSGPLSSADFSFSVDTNQTVMFTNNSTGTTFEWDFGDGNTSTDVVPTHTYADGGTYMVQLVASQNNGPCSDTLVQEVNVATTNIQDDLLNAQVIVFPNPSNGVFLLDINLDSPEEVRIEVRNMIGQTVFESPARNMQAGEIQLNLEGHQSGIYLMTLWANDRQITRKLSLNK